MLNLRLGKITQFFFPHYSFCLQCQTTWNIVHNHCVLINNGGGMFALCQRCWSETSIDQRLTAHREVWNGWWRWGPPNYTWPEVETAVRKDSVKVQCDSCKAIEWVNLGRDGTGEITWCRRCRHIMLPA